MYRNIKKKVFNILQILTFTLIFAYSGAAIGNEPICSQINFEGSGTSERPYQISNLKQLQCIDKDLNATYRITRDVNASESEEWEKGFQPIGEFKGELRGNNHTVKKLYIQRSEKGYTGLFSIVGKTGNVKNLSIRESDIQGAWMTAILSGENRGDLSHIETTGSVSGEGNVGGIVGLNKGNVSFSHTRAEVSGVDQIGGIIGRNQRSGILSYSYSNGSIQTKNTGGGAIGYNEGLVKSVYSVSEVESESWNYSGTFIGMNTGNISASYWMKDENPKSYWYKSPLRDYESINGSSLNQDLMKSNACGMKDFNFSNHWDTKRGSFPILQYSNEMENESRDCTKYFRSQKDLEISNITKDILIIAWIIILLISVYRISSIK